MNRTRAAIESEAVNDKIVQSATEDLLRAIDDYDFQVGDATLPAGLRHIYAELGKFMYYEGLKLGDKSEKHKFSAMPPALQSFMKRLVEEVKNSSPTGRLTPEAEKSMDKVKDFIAGGDVLSQPEISAEMSLLLRLLV